MALDIKKIINLTETRGGDMVTQTTQECASQPSAVAEGLTMTMSPKAAELALLIVHFFWKHKEACTPLLSRRVMNGLGFQSGTTRPSELVLVM